MNPTTRGPNGSSTDARPGDGGRSTGLQVTDLVALATVLMSVAAALLTAEDRASVLVIASVILCAVTAVAWWRTGRRALRWAWGVTCVLLLVTAVASAMLRLGGDAGSARDGTEERRGGTASSTPAPGGPTASTTGPPTTSSGTRAPEVQPASRCVRSFAAVPCSGTGTMVQVSVDPCSPSAVLRRWGLLADLDVLLILTSERDGSCYVGASAVASSQVTGNDLMRAADGSVAPRLRACFLASGEPVPCSLRHTGELVGDWHEDDGSDHGPACMEAAVRYVGRTIAVGSDIQPTVVEDQSGGRYRCAVTSTEPLTGTLRNLGGAALPTVEGQ